MLTYVFKKLHICNVVWSDDDIINDNKQVHIIVGHNAKIVYVGT